MSTKTAPAGGSATSNEAIKLRVNTIVSFLNEYKALTDAYISDFFVREHWGSVPDAWQPVLSSLQPPELASLLCADTWKSRQVWPLSLLCYRSAAHSLCLKRKPTAAGYPSPSACPSNHNDTARGGQDSKTATVTDGQLMALEHCYRRHVKPKKQHEIQKLGECLNDLCQHAHCTHVVDVGAGQGHLSRLLTFGYGLKVTTIEASGHHIPKAQQFDSEVVTDIEKGRILTRKKRQQQKTRHMPNLEGATPTPTPTPTCHPIPATEQQPNHVIGMVDPDISVQAFLEKLQLCQRTPVTCMNPSQPVNKEGKSQGSRRHHSEETDPGSGSTCVEDSEPERTKFALTGLHACGDLTPTILRVFTKCSSAVGLASVACCYMKMTTDSVSNPAQEAGYPMSQHMRELADHELSWESREMACHFIDSYHDRLLENPENLVIHGYRAALQEILLKKDPSIEHGSIKLTVKKAHRLPFKQYAELALKKLGLDPTLTDSELQQAELRLQDWQKVVAFFTLRLTLAPVIESLILLDRVLFLGEQGIPSSLVPIFDPHLSPRNFLLLASKTR